jgi:hypothetical protein
MALIHEVAILEELPNAAEYIQGLITEAGGTKRIGAGARLLSSGGTVESRRGDPKNVQGNGQSSGSVGQDGSVPKRGRGDKGQAQGEEQAGTGDAADGSGDEQSRRLSPAADGTSRFAKAYKLDAAKSLLMQTATPFMAALGVLQNWTEAKVDLDKPVAVSDAQVARMASLVQVQVPRMVDALNARLNQKTKYTTVGSKRDGNKQELTPAQMAKLSAKEAGLDVTTKKETRALNIVDPETGKYDPQLIEAAALAGVHCSLECWNIGQM